MAYTGRERPYRNRVRPNTAQKSDAATSALTAQVILCALMILLVLLVKKTDAPRYDAFKSEYSAMLSPSSGGLAGLDAAGGVFAGLREKAGGLLDWFLSAKPAPLPEGEEDAGGVDLDEPEDPPEPPAGDDSGAADYALSYNYLESKVVSYITASPGGGAGAFEKITGTDNMTPAPAGSVLSPVYLGSKITPPLTGLITSGFSYRYHPLTGKSDFHTGIDIAADEGTPILAALPGEVAEVGYNDIYGHYITLKHATNLQTSYAHCSEIIAKTGMSVRQGERIALVGQTGTTTGPHLHFSVIVEGQYTDPAWVLNDYIKLVE